MYLNNEAIFSIPEILRCDIMSISFIPFVFFFATGDKCRSGHSLTASTAAFSSIAKFSMPDCLPFTIAAHVQCMCCIIMVHSESVLRLTVAQGT